MTYDASLGEAAQYVQVAQSLRRGVEPKEWGRAIAPVARMYGALVVPEANAHGVGLVDELKDLGVDIYRRRVYGKAGELLEESYGFLSTAGKTASGAKVVLYGNLRKAYHGGVLLLRSLKTALEFGTFVDNEGLLGGVGTNHDDAVTECALALEGWRYLGYDGPLELGLTVMVDDSDGGEIPKLNRRNLLKSFGRVFRGDDSVDEENDSWIAARL
jgi:hypothetical protein